MRSNPSVEGSHSVSRLEERWNREQILARGANRILAGHIYTKEEIDDQGWPFYISDQGMGHIDLIGQRQLAEILIGQVASGLPVASQWQPLEMPYVKYYCLHSVDVPDIYGRPDISANN